MSLEQILLFIPTSWFISIIPGMCMTLSMSLAITIGFKRTSRMMIGSLLGTAIIFITVTSGGTIIINNHTKLFSFIQIAGAAYIGYLGFKLFISKDFVDLKNISKNPLNPTNFKLSNQQLFVKGFIVAISNPKGWLLLISLIPPFIDHTKNTTIQSIILLFTFLTFEFISLCIYALGGQTLRHFLTKNNNQTLINRVSGVSLIGIAIWLLF